MDEPQKRAFEAFSRGEVQAIELRRRLDGSTYGDVLLLLREAPLPLPHAPTAGHEDDLARARAWMFPKNGA